MGYNIQSFGWSIITTESMGNKYQRMLVLSIVMSHRLSFSRDLNAKHIVYLLMTSLYGMVSGGFCLTRLNLTSKSVLSL
jgi:hypothetical protein